MYGGATFTENKVVLACLHKQYASRHLTVRQTLQAACLAGWRPRRAAVTLAGRGPPPAAGSQAP